MESFVRQALNKIVRPQDLATALKNWDLIEAELASHKITDKFNLAGVAATVHVETGGSFLPLKEIGGNAYFVRMYYNNVGVRKSLENLSPQDAIDYCGKGYIQITGKHNYEKAGGALNLPLLSQPNLAMQPDIAARILAWYWRTHGCDVRCREISQLPAGKRDGANGWQRVRRAVNGGLNGWNDFHEVLGKLEVL
jgi:hypothetical protein